VLFNVQQLSLILCNLITISAGWLNLQSIVMWIRIRFGSAFNYVPISGSKCGSDLEKKEEKIGKTDIKVM